MSTRTLVQIDLEMIAAFGVWPGPEMCISVHCARRDGGRVGDSGVCSAKGRSTACEGIDDALASCLTLVHHVASENHSKLRLLSYLVGATNTANIRV